MTTTLAPADAHVRYHPIRGAVYGLLFGFGLALLLMVFKVLALSVPVIVVLSIVFAVLGGLWGRFAPPRAAKDQRPTTIVEPEMASATATAPATPTPAPSPSPAPEAEANPAPPTVTD